MNEGHRNQFALLQGRLKGVSKAEFAAVVAQAAEELGDQDFEDIQERAVNLIAGLQLGKGKNLLPSRGEPSILSWDLGRAINLCRWGYDVQYLGKEEALKLIVDCAAQLAKTYDSWKELSGGYLLGFFFWSGDEDEFEDLAQGQDLLLSHEASPWTAIPW
jgi:uncharacterized protein YfiM (DUF2279 family)